MPKIDKPQLSPRFCTFLVVRNSRGKLLTLSSFNQRSRLHSKELFSQKRSLYLCASTMVYWRDYDVLSYSSVIHDSNKAQLALEFFPRGSYGAAAEILNDFKTLKGKVSFCGLLTVQVLS